jgi:hypothetical protein
MDALTPKKSGSNEISLGIQGVGLLVCFSPNQQTNYPTNP